jgi:hypothetical protein
MEQNIIRGTPTTTMGLDPGNPSTSPANFTTSQEQQVYTLRLERQKKWYQRSQPFSVRLNGEDVDTLIDGGEPMVIEAIVGDTIEIYYLANSSYSKNSSNILIIRVQRPGNHYARVKQASDWTYCVVNAVLKRSGGMIFILPAALISVTALFKYHAALWQDVVRCKTDNPDIDNGSLVITSRSNTTSL